MNDTDKNRKPEGAPQTLLQQRYADLRARYEDTLRALWDIRDINRGKDPRAWPWEDRALAERLDKRCSQLEREMTITKYAIVDEYYAAKTSLKMDEEKS